jgi:hypothetical protein
MFVETRLQKNIETGNKAKANNIPLCQQNTQKYIHIKPKQLTATHYKQQRTCEANSSKATASEQNLMVCKESKKLNY